MKDKEEFDDVPNDYFEDRISRLERKYNILAIAVMLCGIAIILIGIAWPNNT